MPLKLNTYTQRLEVAEDGRRDLQLHVLQYELDGHVIGRLRLESSGEVYSLWVDPKHRRQGIATELWQAAEAVNGITPLHSAWRTDDGDAFARSFNVQLPDRLYA